MPFFFTNLTFVFFVICNNFASKLNNPKSTGKCAFSLM